MSELQYLRRVDLIVSGASGDGLNLSGMRITFKTKKSDAQTPNTAEIRIYNLAPSTAKQIRDEFTQITLQAGYEANFGIIFTGNIKQVRFGRENGTDTFIDIAAGDGDDAYNFSVINTTLAAGATQTDQINAAGKALERRGVGVGFLAETPPEALPRGKAMYGMARDYLRQSSEASEATWSIQDGKLQLVARTGTLPDQAILLNSKSGLIGTPEQTNDGISVRTLLNPLMKIGGQVKIDEDDVAEAKLPNTEGSASPNKPASIASDGIYRILTIENSGDTRGNDWYTDIVCLAVDDTAPEGEQVKPT